MLKKSGKFGKQTDQNVITQNLRHVKDHRIFEEKETVKTM